MLGLFSTLIDTVQRRAEVRPLPAAPVATVLPATDATEPDEGALGYAEGQSFIIEYEDAQGEASTRRVTVIEIRRAAGGAPALYARCHERRAMRLFRVDRITSCIDFDGEVHNDVAAFMRDSFGMTAELSPAAPPRQPEHRVWGAIRRAHAAHLMLLTALSHADAEMIPEEVDVIVDWCERRAIAEGMRPDAEFRRLARRYAMRLRPDGQLVARALEDLYNQDPGTVVPLLAAGIAVIDADGLRHPEERDLLNRIAEDLSGLPII